MKRDIEQKQANLVTETVQLDLVISEDDPWDFDEDRKKDPAQEYMRSLLYDAKRWKESGHPEFEKRVLMVLKDFLDEHIQML